MITPICTAPLCGKPATYFNLGTYCGKHWQQVRKFGKLTPEREQDYHSPICLVKNCGRQAHTRNLCTGHYSQVRDDLAIAPLKIKTVCVIVDCDRLAQVKNLCQTHHKQYINGLAFRPLWFGKTKRCVVPGCPRDHYARGLCSAHYEQRRDFRSIASANVPCIICGETRGTQRCHIIPRRDGGTEEPNNIIQLCPTHHWCYDHDTLLDEELEPIISAESRIRRAS